MLSWAKKGGQLTTHARGVVFGMHIAGMSALAIADRMGMTPNGVRHSIAISETIVHGGRDETIPSAPTTPSPKKLMECSLCVFDRHNEIFLKGFTSA
jgi:hypothetical protein